MRERDCPLTIRCTPAYKGVEGNEIADTYAKWAADGYSDAIDKKYLREASLAHLIRKVTEAKTRNTKDWIRRHVKAERRYRPPGGEKYGKTSGKEVRKSPADIFNSFPATQLSAHIWPRLRRQYGLTTVGRDPAKGGKMVTVAVMALRAGM